MMRPALVLFVLLSAIIGVAYPLLVTVVSQALFAGQANGSIVVMNGRTVGSTLIGQPFTEAKYFWSRPSATAPEPYNAAASSGSNLGPLNPALLDAVKTRVEALRAADPSNASPVPIDLVTTSASGLDPEISLAAAYYQSARVAKLRGMGKNAVDALIDRYAQQRLLGIFGEPRVNVLALNMALDAVL
jgi:K+-transporting ATPase ATPase C chain